MLATGLQEFRNLGKAANGCTQHWQGVREAETKPGRGAKSEPTRITTSILCYGPSKIFDWPLRTFEQFVASLLTSRECVSRDRSEKIRPRMSTTNFPAK